MSQHPRIGLKNGPTFAGSHTGHQINLLIDANSSYSEVLSFNDLPIPFAVFPQSSFRQPYVSGWLALRRSGAPSPSRSF